MKLSIIIPHHLEKEELFSHLLSSLNSQINVDYSEVEVIICQDEENFSFSFLGKYNNILESLKVVDTRQVKGNIGLSRQAGIDIATGDYIMFCDADDLLPSVTCLSNVLSVIESGYDLYNFNFVQETYDGKSFSYNDIGENITWVFGKAFSRKFLAKNNIRFSEDLIYHEDTYFNILLCAFEPKTFNSSVEAYLWRFNPNSITRSNRCEYYYSSLPEFIKAVSLADQKIDSLGIRSYNKKKELMIQFIATVYGYLQHRAEILDKYREEIESSLKKYIEENDKNLDCLKEENYYLVYRGIKKAENFNLVPKEGFEQFICRICDANKENK